MGLSVTGTAGVLLEGRRGVVSWTIVELVVGVVARPEVDFGKADMDTGLWMGGGGLDAVG